MKQSFLDTFKIHSQREHVIAMVGGGGKTSLIFRLADELTDRKKKVIITTTTHMAWEPDRPFAPADAPEEVRNQVLKYGYTVTGHYLLEDGKLGGCSQAELDELIPLADVLLVEADGAKRKPLKVPREYEPVIPLQTDLVIGVIVLDCLGGRICDVAHRPEEVADFLKKDILDRITEEDLVQIALSEKALKKGTKNGEYLVYFNKTDVVLQKEHVADILKEDTKGKIRIHCGSILKGEITI